MWRPLRTLHRCNPGAPLRRILWWRFLQYLVWLGLTLFYRHRCWGVRRIPAEGPVLLVANHQSYLDLIVIGCGIQHRHFHSMARRTLFNNPLFAAFIRSLNAFEVDQSRGDIRAIRTAIDQLRRGHLLLVFPEGSRSPDGRVQPFQRGVMTLIRRARPTVIPVAVEGAFDIWPIWRRRPRPTGRIAAAYGRPIPAESLLDMDPDEAIDLLRRRVDQLRHDLRQRLRLQTHGRFPPPGPADHSEHSNSDSAAL